jgi:2-desacetyl-2-hydroxyethyl bacteriochlorophyllide A dehydrogenase
VPAPSPVEAVVRVVASGVCATDVGIFRGRVPVPAGRVLGHEGAGIVEVAPRGAALEQGTPVIIDPNVYCGTCPVCREGLPNLCPNGGLLGRDVDGVFVDELPVALSSLHALPDAIRLENAPLLQVLATVVHAQERVRVVPGRLAAVVGLGCTGQLHAQLLATRGARVLGISRSESKRALAAALACEWTAAPDEALGLAAGLDARGGADLVVEAGGTLASLETAIRLVRPGGTVLAYGIYTETEGSLPYYELYRKEIRVIGARSSLPRDMEIAVELAAGGAVQLEPIVSDRLSLEAVADAFDRAAAGALKVVLEHR